MAAIPDSMPVLSRGKHKHPSRGACFLEYTSLIAGERFSDAPACVDRELAAVLRHANDLLTDADRPRLVPLLGRAVGLVVPPPTAADGWHPPAGMTADRIDDAVGAYARTTAALHRRVASRFLAAIGYVPSAEEHREYDDGRDLDRFFWFLMQRPVAVRSSADYVGRLVDRLVLLHESFEEALAELGLRQPEVVVPVPRAPSGVTETMPG
ncbi:hypothetical protein ACI797_08600 [Geodermatophilus sp. SYSU D00691]